LSKGEKDRAIPLLRLALDKDPKYVRAIIVLGQTLLQNGFLVEAIEHFERAISVLIHVGQPTEIEEVDNLILASNWAGAAYAKQGKFVEGLVHLERISSLKEPEDLKSKAHYYDGLVLLARYFKDRVNDLMHPQRIKKFALCTPKLMHPKLTKYCGIRQLLLGQFLSE
jgi:YidC/Oxa1 family membrane protein insertase